MTPKERAEKVTIKIATNGAMRSEINGDMARWIEEAIKAAIEGEREACEKIADEIRAREDAKESERCDGPFYSTIAEEIRDEIAARSRPKGD